MTSPLILDAGKRAAPSRITSVRFSRYKAFREFSLTLNRFNILVGPNNSGKSTILGAFRKLAEAIRKAKAKSPTFVQGPRGRTRGYEISLGNIPVATENVFYNYNEDQPASVSFRISTGDHLFLFFPEPGICNLVCETSGRPVTSPSAFRQRFNLDIGSVPILGPVEHDEILYQKEAAREALLTHRASRNFRNIWYHYPDSFDEFRSQIQATWPGMDIKKPEVDTSHSKPLLRMFCPEDRIDREIFWAGFGFQVWCQMLTYMVINRAASLFIIDEPDIYLHSDLQRQLVTALKALGPDILLATHSTEIISEGDPDEILVVTKKAHSAKRVGDPSQLRSIFGILGSNLNPTLTQLARSKRVVFVEGKDFQVMARFAAKLGIRSVAMRSDFAVVPTEGFNHVKAKTFIEGVQATLASKISAALVFDRDYRSDSEVAAELSELNRFCDYAHIHSKKELENFLLVPNALTRAIGQRITEQNKRTGGNASFSEDMRTVLLKITDTMKHDVQAQFLKRQHPFTKSLNRSLDDSTVTSQLLAAFDDKWNDLDTRLDMIPGKEVLSRLNALLQKVCGVTVSPSLIIEAMDASDVASEMKEIIDALREFSESVVK
jgi:energy-coupling factor transporter ATP-binding protein EcfA2